MSALNMNTNGVSKAAGFSLIELMIAMMLGLLVLGAAVAIFQSNQRTFGANEGLNRVQENARAAYEMLTLDARSSGSSACSNEARVLGSDASSAAFRAPLGGSASQFTTVSADDVSYRVNGATPNSVTLVETAPSASDAFKANDIVMVCNGAMTGFATVASTSGQTVNFTAPLEFDPDDVEGAAAASISIARLRNTTWATSGGTLTRNGEAVADGVQSLALTYHQANTANYVAVPDFSRVDAMRVGMPIKLDMPIKNNDGVGMSSVERNIATVVNVRSRTP